MLVNVFPNNYCWPPGFAVDENAADSTFVDDKSLPDVYNAEQKATELVNFIQKGYNRTKSQHVLIPMGCDFSF
jgi:hypothetical protein